MQLPCSDNECDAGTYRRFSRERIHSIIIIRNLYSAIMRSCTRMAEMHFYRLAYETEFGVFPTVTDVIGIRKRKFIVKYDLSDNLLCQLCKKIVTILFVDCVSILSLVKFSSMYYIYFILALLYRFNLNSTHSLTHSLTYTCLLAALMRKLYCSFQTMQTRCVAGGYCYYFVCQH